MKMRLSAAGLAAVALTVPLAGCSAGEGVPTTPTAAAPGESVGSASASPSGAQALPPVMADVAKVDGSTQVVPLDRVLVLTGATDPATKWKAELTPTGIVEFVPDKDDGSARFNPGLKPLAAGEAKVTVENSDTGAKATFTVKVS